MAEQYTTVVIADSQQLSRLGLRYVIDRKGGFRIVGEAGDEEELLEELENHHPETLILDYAQPTHFKIDTIRKVQQAHPDVRLLIVSADDKRENIYKVLELGVNRFVTKNCQEQEIGDALVATQRDEKFFCSRVLDYLLEKSFPARQPDVPSSPTPLSTRELEIVRFIAEGKIAKEIAEVLHLSTHTIYTHRKNILRKLNISTPSELMLYALKNGLVKE